MKQLTIIFILILLSNQLFPQDTLSKKQIRKIKCNFLLTDRSWTAELPIWIPGFAGEFAYGDVDIEGDDGVDIENPIEPPESIIGQIISRLFKNEWYLRFFFLTRIAYEKKNFLFQFDAISANVGNSTKWTANQNNKELLDVYFRGTFIRFMLGYKILETTTINNRFRYELFGYTGSRVYYYSIKTDIPNSSANISLSPLFADPLLGIQNQLTWKRWMIVAQGDYGGLLLNDKLSLQFSIYAYHRLGKLNSIKLGWNHLYINHAGQYRGEQYQIKTTLSGPSMGLAFHF